MVTLRLMVKIIMAVVKIDGDMKIDVDGGIEIDFGDNFFDFD